ncbi:hypothetical protein [Paenibacillus macquariensis]|uniref:Uncharacterized protein n=1 Tax=Paenibacillus macquariensis TaxID=948756 RepID=A0ABY1JP03_9BACL|nr:hypothetical protein [Paenibacillus macquariensis]MEC0092052.1 hypothetical protein [Paenibacillus macquariensis]SIQ51993.1 hypothetical protein SAMN05421578_102381 [Paenibacillus macquariensis]
MLKGRVRKVFSMLITIVMLSSITVTTSSTRVMAAAGKTYYVDNVSGNDSNVGTDSGGCMEDISQS